MYAYGRTFEDGEPTFEDSPADHARYRSMYVKFMRESAADGSEASTTGRSLLIDNLCIETDNPICTDGIVEKVFEECLRARKWQREKNGKATQDDDEPYFYELVEEPEEGSSNEEQLAIVKEGFFALYEALDDLDGEFWSYAEGTGPVKSCSGEDGDASSE